MAEKTCKTCKEAKPDTEKYFRPRHSQCKDCVYKKQRQKIADSLQSRDDMAWMIGIVLGKFNPKRILQ